MSINSSKPDLDQVLSQLWEALRLGSEQFRHPFHTPVLATTSAGGPEARTVVLRDAIEASGSLICHTDLRSPKAREIQANPGVTWLFYDREEKTQLRLRGRARLHHRDSLAEQRWQATKPASRACYRAELAPGAPEGSEPFNSWLPDEGFANFAVINCRISAIDWLYLRAKGHWRAYFTRQKDHWHGAWIAP